MKRLLVLAVTAASLAGCSSVGTLKVTPTNYDARVMILRGNVEGTSTRSWFLGLGGLSNGAFEATKNAEQAAGADLLLNPAVDTQTTSYVFGLFTQEETTVRGLAVSFIPSYKSKWNGAQASAAVASSQAAPAAAPAPAVVATVAPTAVPTAAPTPAPTAAAAAPVAPPPPPAPSIIIPTP